MSVEETPLAVTDTHALIWAVDGKAQALGQTCPAALRQSG